MRSTFKIVFLIVVSLFLVQSGTAQLADPNARIKSLFIYNFTKYIEWPADYKTGDFVIGVYGETSATPELLTMAKTKKAGVQNIVIKEFSDLESISKCHILYVASDKTKDFIGVLSVMKKFNALVITESDGLARRGSVINFVMRDNKQKFELSRNNASKFGLTVSKSLVDLAIAID